MSATQLLSSPRMVQLRSRHDQDIVQDASDQVYMLVGKALHSIIHEGTDNTDGTTTEERLYADVEGWRISGQIDLQETASGLVLSDWKYTSCFAVMNEKPEWERQLNIYKFLAERNGRAVAGLQVVALLRDWSKREAEKSSFGDGNYPKAAMVVVPIKIWSAAEAEAYVRDRVRLHQSAAIEAEIGGELPECTEDDRWMRKTKWAVHRPGIERPARLFDSEGEAKEWVAGNSGAALTIKRRSGQPTRCLSYCLAAPFCSQHARWKEENGK